MRILRVERKTYIYLIFFTATLLSLIVIFSYNDKSLPTRTSPATQKVIYTQCNCAVFRLDDIEDYGKNKVQSAILDHFITENKKLVAAIILDRFGNLAPYGKVYTKVKEGHDKGLFEPAIHGLKHINYPGLSKEEQKETLTEANNRLQSLLGKKSRIFAPPLNQFDSYTIQAMAKSGMDILSTTYREENNTSNPYKVSTLSATNNSKIELSEVNIIETGSSQTLNETIYHVPFNVSLLDLTRRGYSGENLTEKVISNVNSNIAKFGFSVIVLHPNDFATFDSATESYVNTLDTNKFQTLVNIIDGLDAITIKIAFYQDVID